MDRGETWGAGDTYARLAVDPDMKEKTTIRPCLSVASNRTTRLARHRNKMHHPWIKAFHEQRIANEPQ